MTPRTNTDQDRVLGLGYALGLVSTHIEMVARAARDVYQEQHPDLAYTALMESLNRIRGLCAATASELVEMRDQAMRDLKTT